MRFKASEITIKTIVANAYNASIPVGMGIVHYKHGSIEPLSIQIDTSGSVYVDYMMGRMVKLELRKLDDGTWELPNGSIVNPDQEYQSWAKTYPTYKNLLLRSGVKEGDFL